MDDGLGPNAKRESEPEEAFVQQQSRGGGLKLDDGASSRLNEGIVAFVHEHFGLFLPHRNVNNRNVRVHVGLILSWNQIR